MKHLELGFIGFGLIGGSIAKALKKQNCDITVKVYTRRKNPELEKGQNEGIIDEILYEIDHRFSTCDIIFLCAPVMKNADFLPLLKPVIKPDCILTDVGSVKENICQKAAELHLEKQFIGGHPMAGSEKTGYENSTDILLQNAYYFLTPTPENDSEDVSLLKEIVCLTGASCVMISAAEHDKITAAISHVPHIIAVTLVNMVRAHDNEEENMKIFAAGGFRDITRIASSSPEMWQDICLTNGTCIDDFLAYFQKQLQEFREMIHKKNGSAICHTFQTAGHYRDSIPAKKSSVLARIYDLYINVDDRTGAIAEIATLLSQKSISIKNIGILHNREFTDGVMKLELYNEEDALQARNLLENANYEIVKSLSYPQK